jgi:microcystin-dependent protein
MAINFPDSPSTNDAYTVNGRTYIWSGEKWLRAQPELTSVVPTLTVSNDLAVDTDTLHVDSTNDRVGIGTASPAYDLDVSGEVNASTDMRIAGVSLDGLIRSAMPVGSVIPFAGASSPDATWVVCDGSAISRTTYAALFAVLGTTYGAGDGSTTFNIPNMGGRVPVGLDSGQTEFDALGETGGAKTHTLAESEMPSHTHTQNSHNHTQNSHNHTQNQHRHSISHNHGAFNTASGGSHTHVLNRSTNGVYSSSGSGIQFQGTAYTGDTVLSTNSNHAHTIDVPNFTGNSGYSTPTNNATTATNQAATATNQNTGGGNAHNILQPYMALNYIMKAA